MSAAWSPSAAREAMRRRCAQPCLNRSPGCPVRGAHEQCEFIDDEVKHALDGRLGVFDCRESFERFCERIWAPWDVPWVDLRTDFAACHCESDADTENIGPHIESCPWSDPDYDDGGVT